MGTIVDATLVRYYPDAYDGVLAGRSAQERRLIEDTLAGHTIGETFGRAAAFLREVAAQAVPAAGVSPQPAP
ncbi:MAG: hypothetical protein ACRDNF_21865 [Streptosporangiaceae bacterium]